LSTSGLARERAGQSDVPDREFSHGTYSCLCTIGTATPGGADHPAVSRLGGDFAWGWRAAFIVGVLFATLPVSSHMLARAAARESMTPEMLAQFHAAGDTPEPAE